jgi:pyrimidine 5'-nucleotidase
MLSILAALDVAAFATVAALVVRKRALASVVVPVQAVFIDCDDCCYQNDWRTAKKITAAIAKYTAKLGVSTEEAYKLYKQHGTCLKGLLVEGRIDAGGAEDFLRCAHDIDYSDINHDPNLRSELAKLKVPHWIFTASTSEHATRCMERIGLADLPWKGIIDTRSVDLETKHSRSSFETAMRLAGVLDPKACVFCDDSVKNIIAAKAIGWRTVLVGLNDRDTGARIVCDAADAHIEHLDQLRGVMPELFHRK